jgi:hypothetical protein
MQISAAASPIYRPATCHYAPAVSDEPVACAMPPAMLGRDVIADSLHIARNAAGLISSQLRLNSMR